jgi:hypothetical protein
MRSQVQVLAGPPPIVAGHSAAGTELGALAAGLGRAGAARPSRPARPVAPPGPPTRPSGSATTTHRGRAPARGRPPRGGCSHLVLQPAPVPTAPPPARSAPIAGLACLVAQWSSAAAAARTQPAARDRHRPPTGQRDVGSLAGVPASSTIARAVDGPAATGALPVPVVTVARPPRPWSQRYRLRWRRRTRPDGQGPTPDGWTPDGWTADGWTPDGWTADGRAPDPLDDDQPR